MDPRILQHFTALLWGLNLHIYQYLFFNNEHDKLGAVFMTEEGLKPADAEKSMYKIIITQWCTF